MLQRIASRLLKIRQVDNKVERRVPCCLWPYDISVPKNKLDSS